MKDAKFWAGILLCVAILLLIGFALWLTHNLGVLFLGMVVVVILYVITITASEPPPSPKTKHKNEES